MMSYSCRVVFALVSLYCCLATSIVAVAEEKSAANEEQIAFFEKKIRPVLVQHCYQCHSAKAKKVQGGLLLDTRTGIRKGGDTAPSVVPGNVKDSLLIDALKYDGIEMPPNQKLPDSVIADFEQWIKLGAHDPRDGEVKAESPKTVDFAKGKSFWAFQPPHKHAAPAVRNEKWEQRPIDAFVLEKLEAAGLTPSASADRRTLIRRVSLDLTGLPPTPEEVEKFVTDNSPTAYADLVERLLASRHYGERVARMWLDVARYAEDQAHVVGNDLSLCFPNAYLYRDWVIQALNDDTPYDQFIRQQLAADLISSADTSSHAALGFIGVGPKYYARNSKAVMADEWEDRVDVVCRGLLGLTVVCARCHDHKYDPISTEDYYALAGVFASTEMFNRPLDDKAETVKNGQAKDPRLAVHIIRDNEEPTNLNVFIRGDVDTKGDLVPRRFVQVLCSEDPKPFATGSGRLELAAAIANRDNPLTARVIVNRIWALNFGKPLVGTPSNFGALGEKPTHPELLDDLAVRFMDNGWSLKWLEREIVLSATYQQSSRATDKQASADPENKLLGRMNRKRLDVEQWRDSLLAATGRLDESIGGKSIDPQNAEERRRTVYSNISRLDLNRMLAMFDFPDPNAHSARRSQTTTPLQKLFVLNSQFVVKQAQHLAARLQAETEGIPNTDARIRIDRAYRLVFGRPATDTEIALGLSFVSQPGSDANSPWREYTQALLASNELLFVD